MNKTVSKEDPHQHRKEDHIVFVILTLPIFAISVGVIVLIVTLGTR